MRQYILLGAALASLGACATKPALVHDIGAMTPDRLSPGLTRRYIMADNSTMAIYDLRKGARVSVHRHSSEQLSYVQTGRLRFLVGGQSFDVRAGQVIVIPPFAPHSIEALENSVEIDFFAPAHFGWTEEGEASTELPSGPPGSRQP